MVVFEDFLLANVICFAVIYTVFIREEIRLEELLKETKEIYGSVFEEKIF